MARRHPRRRRPEYENDHESRHPLSSAALLGGRRGVMTSAPVPHLLTPDEVAGVLRTTKKAIYAMVERAQLPGVVRIGRRVLIREEALLDWLRQKAAPSPER
jgi:excisionase family DNA binding protein